MNIYLDIDGVLLKKDLTVPEFGEEFISYLVTHHDCHWLSTHCKGDGNTALAYLSKYYPPLILKKLERIKPTGWTNLKTEAIDLQSDFIWLEDYPFEAEKQVLRKANKIDGLIIVDLNRENELKSIQLRIESLI